MSRLVFELDNPPMRTIGSGLENAYNLEKDFAKWESNILAAMREDGWIKVEEAVKALPAEPLESEYDRWLDFIAAHSTWVKCNNALRSLAGKGE